VAGSKRLPPDVIVHRLVTNVGATVRVYLEGNTARIPVTPYRGTSPPQTELVPLASFDAVIEDVELVDGGLNLSGVNGLRLTDAEWRRIGLAKHWAADDAAIDTDEDAASPQRKLEVWATREDNLYRANSATDRSLDHLSELPDESPLLTAWRNRESDSPEKPPVPFSRPTLTVEAVHARGVRDTKGLDRVELGAIEGLEILEPPAE
jgi:hypothetical protein